MSYIKTLINKCIEYLKKDYNKIKPENKFAWMLFFYCAIISYFGYKKLHWVAALIWILSIILIEIRNRVLARRELDKQDNMK